jgi:hypothetical protein
VRGLEAGADPGVDAPTTTEPLPNHVARNRAAWDEWAPEYVGNAELSWGLAPEPASNALIRPYRGLHRLEWESDDSVNFHLGYGDWIRLLRASDFDVEDLVELWPAEDATTRSRT